MSNKNKRFFAYSVFIRLLRGRIPTIAIFLLHPSNFVLRSVVSDRFFVDLTTQISQLGLFVWAPSQIPKAFFP